MLRRYEVIPHTADTAIIAYGSTLEELFENAAFAMFDLIFDLSAATPNRDVPVVAAGDTPEDLLVDWLSELLGVGETEGLALCSFNVDRLEEGGVQGSASGVRLDTLPRRGHPIKAVTYHDLAIVPIPDGFWARIIFDV